MKPNIAFLPAGLDGCALYRMFFAHLRTADSIFLFQPAAMAVDILKDRNLVVVQRLSSQQNYEAMKLFKKMNLKIIYDLDDDLWSVPTFNPAFKLMKAWLPGFEICAKMADLITVSTEHLKVMVKKALGKACPRIEVIENAVDFDWFRPVRKEYKRQKDGRVILGWAGTDTHSGDVDRVFSLLPKLLTEYKELEFELVGEKMPKELEAFGDRVRQRYFVPIAEFASNWASWQWDISLAPVAENQFNLSKCLSGGTSIYGLVDGWPRRTRLESFLKCNGEKRLPGPDGKWRKVVAWRSLEEQIGLAVRVRGGDIFHVTQQHRFMLDNGKLCMAKDLKVGTKLKMLSRASVPKVDDCSEIATYENGWVLGFYLADGNMSHKEGPRGGLSTICFSVDRKDVVDIQRLKKVATRWGAFVSYGESRKGQGAGVYLHGSPALRGFILQYAGGVDSYTKHFRQQVWLESVDFIRGIVDGWLDGDGTKPIKPLVNVWHFGITRNWNLVLDLQLACTLIGYKFRYKRRFAEGFGKLYKIISGSIRKRAKSYQSERNNGEVLKVYSLPILPYAVEVSNDNLFVLPSGVVSHNSNIKMIEAAALKIPCVASRYGEYQKFADNSKLLKTAVMADGPKDWKTKIGRLIKDKEYRLDVGEEMYRVGLTKYNIVSRVKQWNVLFSELLV